MVRSPLIATLLLAVAAAARAQDRPAARSVVVVADVVHSASPDKRTVLDRGPTGFSRLAEALSRHKAKLRINKEPLSPASLQRVDVLLIASLAPDKPLTSEELGAVRRFVADGGTLVLTTNDLSRAGVDAWVALARQFGIQSHGSVIRITPDMALDRCHVARYSGAGLARWLPKTDDARLGFHGTSAGPVRGQVLISYDGAALAASRPLGRGRVYAFGGGDVIGNAFIAGTDAKAVSQPGPPVVNDRLIDALAAELLAGTAAAPSKNGTRK